MAPQTRRTTFPNVVIERDTDSEPSSSDEEEEEEDYKEVEEEEEEGKVVDNKNAERMEESLEAKKKGKTPITISLKKVCKVEETLPLTYRVFRNPTFFFFGFCFCVLFYFIFVMFQVCKKVGHEAGFKGATYIDCPMKPCFLCKMPGKFEPFNLFVEFCLLGIAN